MVLCSWFYLITSQGFNQLEEFVWISTVQVPSFYSHASISKCLTVNVVHLSTARMQGVLQIHDNLRNDISTSKHTQPTLLAYSGLNIWRRHMYNFMGLLVSYVRFLQNHFLKSARQDFLPRRTAVCSDKVKYSTD